MNPQEHESVYDPVAGISSTLLASYTLCKGNIKVLHSQEINSKTWALGVMNALLYGVQDFYFSQGDIFSKPTNVYSDQLRKFNCIVAHIPFNQGKWDANLRSYSQYNNISLEVEDPYLRFQWAVPTSSKGDYAFISHMLSSLESHGKMAVIVPQGCLFRGGSETMIRKNLLQDYLIESVILLPPNLFLGTKIPAVVLVFRKNRIESDVLFIDASGNHYFSIEGKRNILKKSAVEKIRDTVNNRLSTPRFSEVVTLDTLVAHDYDLSVQLYVDCSEEEVPVDIAGFSEEIRQLEDELAKVQGKIKINSQKLL